MPKTDPVLNELQQAAIAGALSGSAASAAKKAVPVGSHAVDFTVRIAGSVTKKPDTPGGTTTVPADVTLTDANAVGELLHRLKVEPAAIRRALRAMVKNAIKREHRSIGGTTFDPHPDLAAVFAEVENEARETLPTQARTSEGRSGSCAATVTVSLV